MVHRYGNGVTRKTMPPDSVQFTLINNSRSPLGLRELFSRLQNVNYFAVSHTRYTFLPGRLLFPLDTCSRL